MKCLHRYTSLIRFGNTVIMGVSRRGRGERGLPGYMILIK